MRHHRGPRRRQGGYVLIMVLAALALIAFAAERFASRIDALRRQTASLSAYADARVAAESGLHAGLYWISTHPGGPGGYGQYPQPGLRADGRLYVLPGGGEMRVQDWRGLLAINTGRREALGLLLRGLDIPSMQADALLDVLLDYQDTDRLKRLNGAELEDYVRAGLPPPRDDWLLGVSELQRLILWRDRPELIQRLQRLASTHREAILNPNTMPMELLRALLPDARPEQLELFETLRREQPFDSDAAVLAGTGLQMRGWDYLYHTSDRLRLTIWTPGLPQAYQYNVVLVPDGAEAPWMISDMQPVDRGATNNGPTERSTPFPLSLANPAAMP